MTYLLAFILMQLSPAGGPAQSQPSSPVADRYVTTHYTTEDGLPANYIVQFVQDERGYLYAATFDGLVVYDGFDFRVINTSNTPGLPGNRIAAITHVPGRGVLMQHEGGPVTLYRNGRVRVLKTPSGQAAVGASIHGFTSDSTLWFNISGGFGRLGEGTRIEPVRFHPGGENPIHVEPASAEAFFVRYREGLYLEKTGGGGRKRLLSSADIPYPSATIRNIIRMENGLTWVITENGFFAFREGEREVLHASERSDTDLILIDIRQVSPERVLFFFDSGFYAADLDSGSVRKLPIPVDTDITMTDGLFRTPSGESVLVGDNEVLVDEQTVFEAESIKNGYVDREGTIWVSVVGDGIYQIKKQYVRNITELDSRPVENVYPIVEDGAGGTWLGTFDDGIFRIGPSGDVRHWSAGNSSLVTGIIRSLYRHPSGTIYAGLWDHGLWRHSGDAWRRISQFSELYNGGAQIEAMYRDERGRFFIGSNSELAVREEGEFSIFEDRTGRRVSAVRAIREDRAGTLWFATGGSGIARLDRTNRLHFISEDEGLNSDVVRDIHIRNRDTLFVATEDRGLNRVVLAGNSGGSASFDVDPEITSVTVRDGLLSNSLHRIIPDRHGNFWISSNQGLMAIPVNRLNDYLDGTADLLPIRRFTEREGMANSEANGGVQTAGLRTSDGEIWFPNQAGVTVVNPSEIAGGTRQWQPKPLIEQVSAGDTLVTVFDRKQITLPRGERNIRVAYTAPTMASSESMRFRYRLEDLMPEWRQGNALNTAELTNLDHGTHRFVVQSYTPEGTLREAALRITVPPYFYETSWFYLLMGVCGVLLVFAGHRYRTRTLKIREQVLQRRVDEQTEELKRAAEEKSQFFTGITHELKTPLSLILGPVDEILEKGADVFSSDRRKRYLRMMRRNGYRLKNLVDQILDVSKLNADAIRLTLQPADISELTLRIAGQFQSMLQQQNVRLERRVDPVEGEVYVDRQAWERILTNLLSNAIRFSPEGERIVLSVNDLGESVEVSVQDFGPGIPPEERRRVFEYLYQAEGREAAGGTGVGLYLVKGLTERMGGTVSLQTEEGKGATFTVSLKKGHGHFREEDRVVHEPISVDGEEAGESGTPVPQIPAGQSPNEDETEQERILVVEDNRDFRSYLHSVLSARYEVFLASEGNEAMEMLEKCRPYLLISDVMMPGMDGLELVRSLRKRDGYRHLPVIFLSAKDREADVEEGLSTGADIYLTKPIRSSMLTSQISAVLRRERILREEQPGTGNGEVKAEKSDLEARVRKIVYRQLGNPDLNIDLLADALYMSRTKLYREWKEISEESLNDYLIGLRMEEARELIVEQGFSVQQAARAVGYTNPGYFSTTFRKTFDRRPSELKV